MRHTQVAAEVAFVETVEGKCREAQFPEDVIELICGYLADTVEQTVEDVRAAWRRHQWRYWGQFVAVFEPEADALHPLDRRMLDLCIAADYVYLFLREIAEAGPVHDALDHVRARGVSERDSIRACLSAGYEGHLLTGQRIPTLLGRELLAYLPDRTDLLLDALTDASRTYTQSVFDSLIQLVLAADAANIWVAREIALRGHTYYIGSSAALLREADPDGFDAWVRRAIEDDHDPQRCYWLLDFLRNKVPVLAAGLALPICSRGIGDDDPWSLLHLKHLALAITFQADPGGTLPLVEAAALIRGRYARWKAMPAVKLLIEGDLPLTRPALQRVAAAGAAPIQKAALDALLEMEWEGRLEYALALLAAPSRQVRDMASTWLTEHDADAAAHAAPVLSHARSGARLAAIRVLVAVGGEEAHAQLAARFAVERAVRVRAALLDALGVLEARRAGVPTSRVETIVVEAARLSPEEVTASFGRLGVAAGAIARLPLPRWKTGARVTPDVIAHLLHLQARAKGMRLAEGAFWRLSLLDRISSGNLALALHEAWTAAGAPKEALRFLPLVCVLGDDRLVPPLQQQIETWSRDRRNPSNRRKAHALAQALVWSSAAAARDEVAYMAERRKLPGRKPTTPGLSKAVTALLAERAAAALLPPT